MFNHSEPNLFIRSEDWKSRPVETFTWPVVKLVAYTYANLLFGESIGLSLSDDAPEDSETALKRILRDSKADIVFFNAAIGQSVEGVSYLKTRRGKKNSRSEKDSVLIEYVNSRSVIKLNDAGNSTFPTGYMIFQEVMTLEGNSALQIEVHYAGSVVHELWEINKETGDPSIGERLTFMENLGFIPDGVPNEGGEVETGVDEILVQEIQNVNTNGWSQPDLLGSENVVRLLEDRLSRDTEILNKHADPKLVVPPGLLNERGSIERSDMDGMLYEQDPASGLFLPQYITWEGHLTESQEYFDRMISLVLANTGLTHQVVGFEGKSGFAESGTALRLRMIPALARVNGKKIQTSPAIDQTVRNSLELADGIEDYGTTMIGVDIDVVQNWRDGIPDDPKESAEVAAMRTGGLATESRETAVKKHNPTMSEDAINDEIEKIQEDESSISSPTQISPNAPSVTRGTTIDLDETPEQ